MSVIHAPRKPELDLRVLIFPIILAVALAVLFFRLWYYQVVKASELQERAEYFGQVTVERPAPRGLIVDRKGRTLAGVQSQTVITAIPREVQRNPWVIHKLAAMLNADPKKIKEKVEAGTWRPWIPTPVYIGVPIQTATRIAESGENLPGVGVETQPMRYYSDSKTFSHILGYVWTPSARDVERLEGLGLKPAEYVGKTAFELQYEKLLMGRPGVERLEVDAKRRPLRVVGRDNAVPGSRLTLAVDVDLQRLGQELLAGRRGAVVALDPTNGEVLALVSAPTYDASLFRNGIGAADFAMLRDDPAKPLLNRAIQSSYQPGSTFKVVTAMAAIEKGIFNPYQTVNCQGGYRLGDRTFRCMGRHGPISFERALEKSCNTYFADLAWRVGKDALRDKALSLGFYARTGIDLPYEGRGIVPTDAWIQRWRRPPVWYGGDTVQMGFGQGDVEATPLQMAALTMLVANRGIGYRPRLLRSVRTGPNGQEERLPPEVAHRVELPAAAWDQIHRAMTAVVQSGTAAGGRIPNLVWAGKTGSAEHRRGAKTHGWFMGYAPADNPRIVVCVIVEAAGHGGEVAVPIAREIVRRYLFPPASAVSSSATAASASAAPAESPVDR